MRTVYDAVVAMVETLEVSADTDRLLQRLGEEMRNPPLGTPALLDAAQILVTNLQSDPRPLARYWRLRSRLADLDTFLVAQEELLLRLLAREMEGQSLN